ncbi:glycosyltransferase family 9 protein [Dyadobacter subterraneus]|uniref:Glycosyltransferase family 9 protein n=1 Tax=Dyadobacter subterraneus TaxID=2773304 RepID=A0ABR9WLA8_9BACT|nr:glycosyltransferase family 9 protein [Dyadobacter subterraneus]MBE9466298.1 glycosyltransferase family 9 protein [Dyadobacter subterraneus]
MHILVTRVDAIGDVVLTLPLCGYIKQTFPGSKVAILARKYTKPVVDASDAVDTFIDYDEVFAMPKKEQTAFIKAFRFDAILHLITQPDLANLGKDAGIRKRVGTISRPYHWVTCNRLVWLRRKVSDDHEANLHFRLLRPLGGGKAPDKLWEYYHLKNFAALPDEFSALLKTDKFNIILHPKSNGNALEWKLDRFSELIDLLDPELFRVYITGSEKEHLELKSWLETLPKHVVDLTGKLPLDQLISFIHDADGLVAGSTGPMHLAAATGINTLGLFPKNRPKHAGRWGPIGRRASFIQTTTEDLDSISAEEVLQEIKKWEKITDN